MSGGNFGQNQKVPGYFWTYFLGIFGCFYKKVYVKYKIFRASHDIFTIFSLNQNHSGKFLKNYKNYDEILVKMGVQKHIFAKRVYRNSNQSITGL